MLKGFVEARKILKTLKPDIVFSKGGFVSVPVVRAAALQKIPCIIHESDMTPGLANNLCIPVVQKICCNFPETLQNLPPDKAVLTGSPIRNELTKGNKEKGLAMCGFDTAKPVIRSSAAASAQPRSTSWSARRSQSCSKIFRSSIYAARTKSITCCSTRKATSSLSSSRTT